MHCECASAQSLGKGIFDSEKHIHNAVKRTHAIPEVIDMAKQGMKRPEHTHTQPRNSAAAVPEIQGKAKHGKAHANPIIAGTASPSQKVYHTKPFSHEKPVSNVYAVIDTDLARDNVENDLTAADIQDL